MTSLNSRLMRDTAMFAILFGGGGGQVTNKKKMYVVVFRSQSESVSNTSTKTHALNYFLLVH